MCCIEKALAAAIVAFVFLYFRHLYTIRPDAVYRKALVQLNTSAGILEVTLLPTHTPLCFDDLLSFPKFQKYPWPLSIYAPVIVFTRVLLETLPLNHVLNLTYNPDLHIRSEMH